MKRVGFLLFLVLMLGIASGTALAQAPVGDGSVYFTDPNYGRWDVPVGVGRKCELDFQGVYRVPPGSAGPGGGDCELVVAEKEFEQPNGLAFSPDESILYVNDRRDLKAFDVAPDGSRSTVQRCRVASTRAPRSRCRSVSAARSVVAMSRWARTGPSASSRRWSRIRSGRCSGLTR